MYINESVESKQLGVFYCTLSNILGGSEVLCTAHKIREKAYECSATEVKGTVAPVWVWLQVIWLERAKIGEEPLSVFKIFHSFFDFE